ncbi:GNAT family N-acetyltransferase [Massilia scottii]|uniref:GNAT family N-acetyltransferase n=1 Tax=Massilia scottii TaxID=3057166 RepID=UPI0027BB17AD|nr:GNAT family protein [Massilia sp. CCM 9210]
MNVFPLSTARLMLRPFTRRDLPAFTAYRNHPEVARYQSWSSYTAEDAQAFFAQQEGMAFDHPDSWFQIAVARQEDGVLVGDVAVHFFDDGQQAELGVTFDTDGQRCGYAREAVSRVITLLFAELGKHRLVATVDVLNLRAQRLLDTQGFRREGHYRENVFFKGAWSDEYSYALLRQEWQEREAAGLSKKDAQ